MSSKWYSKKWVNVLLHTAAWLLLFSLPYLLRPSMNQGKASGPPDTQSPMIHVRYIVNNLIYIGFFYLNTALLVSRFIYKRKYKAYSLIILGFFILILSITGMVNIFLLGKAGLNLKFHILFNFFFFLFMLAASTAFRMIKDRTRADRIAREKENETLKTELSLLRSQASPHFMFNVLNNMVALARKKSDLLEPSLLKFSSLMRYMLYDADEEKVSLEKEIEYLQSYIDLQEQRFGKNLKVCVDLEKPQQDYEIEPMLLIPFVENAFKHGTGMIQDAVIHIKLRMENGQLEFTVQNKYDPAATDVKDKTSGIGLSNVKRRLNLLYGHKHKLLIGQANNLFTVSLQLK